MKSLIVFSLQMALTVAYCSADEDQFSVKHPTLRYVEPNVYFNVNYRGYRSINLRRTVGILQIPM